jgi:hypothetical protein
MWGPGPWGMPMGSIWWVFPLIGALVCLAFLVMAIRVVSTGRGFMCMGSHQGMGNDELAAMHREIRTLRDEIERLKASR